VGLVPRKAFDLSYSEEARPGVRELISLQSERGVIDGGEPGLLTRGKLGVPNVFSGGRASLRET